MLETKKTPEQDPEARAQFLEAIERLISHVEQSEPGFEFDHVRPLLKTLNDTAQKMGYRFFGGVTGQGRMGESKHHRVFMLNHPVDDDTFDIPLYTFDGPPIPSWEGTADEYAVKSVQAHREIERIEYEKLKYNEVNRHLTTAEERGRILTCLRAWRRAVASEMAGDAGGKRKGRKGRRPVYDPKKDAKLYEDWKASGLLTYLDFANERKLRLRETKAAIHREEVRRSKRCQGR